MRKKRLLIVKVNPITFPMDKAEQVRKKIIKQLKKGVIMLDKACTIECYEYDTKQVEVKIIHNDDKVVPVEKG